MHGVGTTSGAVTIVNALSTGLGCAVAVSLPVRVDVELRVAAELSGNRIQLERSADTPLVRETLEAGLVRYAPGKTFSGELWIESEVPIGKGLKSSSAVGGAVLRALVNALRQPRPADELARLAADVSQEIGLSATGAYDDCLAALQGGAVLTDNDRRSTLRLPPFDLSLQVALWIPPDTHAPSSSWHERFQAEAEAGEAAAAAARAGRWAEAMTLNTELVERLIGYDYGELRSDLIRQGALMCGVSGMGPTLAAFVPASQAAAVISRLPPNRGETRLVEIRRGEGGASEAT